MTATETRAPLRRMLEARFGPDWIQEAGRLIASGMSVYDVAEELQVSRATLLLYLKNNKMAVQKRLVCIRTGKIIGI